MSYLTESQLRKVLAKRLAGRTKKQVADEAGINPNALSMMLHSAPITGKLLSYLGYRRVQDRLYERKTAEQK